MKIKTVAILVLSIVLIGSCGKKENKSQNKLKPIGKKSEFTLAEKPELMEGFTLNGMRINDTTNNMQVIVFPLQVMKKEIKTDAKPTYQRIEDIIKVSVAKAQKEPYKGKDKNYLYIQVTKFYKENDTMKCVFLIKEKLVSVKDTTVYYDSIHYVQK
ncbi:MAG: hypothetical protein LBR28_04945 [Bacteroidales bacterium]|jgi:D-hexose-6-phosphate mutarotase|nr:hypothetical protein [Bacteroidales bacterium]